MAQDPGRRSSFPNIRLFGRPGGESALQPLGASLGVSMPVTPPASVGGAVSAASLALARTAEGDRKAPGGRAPRETADISGAKPVAPASAPAAVSSNTVLDTMFGLKKGG